MGSGMGVIIEAWKVIIPINFFFLLTLEKITKAVDIKLIQSPPGSLLPYKLDIKGMTFVLLRRINSDAATFRQACFKWRREENTRVYCLEAFFILSSLMHLDRYDKLAFRYVSYVAIPLLAAYTIYSLFYESHKGWYSFVISTLTSFVYMFGFVSAYPDWLTYSKWPIFLFRRN